MALNVKAAMAVCVSFMAGLCCLMYQVETPRVVAAAPLLHAAEYASRPVAGHPGLIAGDVEWREERARQFNRPNPLARLDTEADAHPTSAEALAARRETAPITAERPALPPLQRKEDPVVAAAELRIPPSPTALAARKVEPPELVARPVSNQQSAPVDVPAVQPPQPMSVVAPPTGPVPAAGSATARQTYTVAAGDSLTRIARRHYQSTDTRYVRLLLEANPQIAKRRNAVVLVGEELLLPPVAAEPTSATAPGAVAGGQPVERAVAPASAQKSAERWYTIQPRDTLERIAQRELDDGARWREILQLNEKLNPHRIQPGMRIKLPPADRIALR